MSGLLGVYRGDSRIGELWLGDEYVVQQCRRYRKL